MTKHILSTLIVLVLIVTTVPNLAVAACGATGGLENPIQYCTLYEFLQGILDVVVAIAFPIIVLFLVYIGGLFIFQGNEPKKLVQARQYFLWAIVGALIVLGAKALSLAIGATVNALGG